MQIEHLQHKHGGRITEIKAVAHCTFKRVASWHYIGSVTWSSGKPSVDIEIAPWAVCFDHDNPEAHQEYSVLAEKLNQYLLDAGEWHDTKFVNHMAVSWTPKAKTGRVEL